MDPKDIDYADMVRTLLKSGETIAAELTSKDQFLLRMATELSSIEVVDTIKRAAIYRKQLDVEKLEDQVGLVRTHAARLLSAARDEFEATDVPRLTGDNANLLHLAVGVGGEGAELMGAVAASALNGDEIDRENLIEELGDLEFYMEGLRQAADITREETLTANKVKLGKRYNGLKYSDQSAQERADKAG